MSIFINARNVKFKGNVNISNSFVSGDMDFSHSKITGKINIKEINLGCAERGPNWDIVFDGSQSGAIELSDVNVRGSVTSIAAKINTKLTISSLYIKHDLQLDSTVVGDSLYAEDLTINGDAYFRNITVKHRLTFYPKLKKETKSQGSVEITEFEYVCIHGILDLGLAKVGYLDFYGVHVKKNFVITTGEFKEFNIKPGVKLARENNNEGKYQIIEYVHSEIGSFHAKYLTVDGDVDFSHAKIGLIEHSDSKSVFSDYRDEVPLGFHLTHSTIKGYINLFPVKWLYRLASTYEKVIIDNSQFGVEEIYVLSDDGNGYANTLFETIVYGEVNIRACDVNASVDLRKVTVLDTNEYRQRYFELQKGANLNYPLGRISLSDVTIRRNLHIKDSFLDDEELLPPEKSKYGYHNIRDVKFRTECSQLILDDVQCGGNVSLEGLTIRDETKKLKERIVATGLKCKGELSFLNVETFEKSGGGRKDRARIEPGKVLLDRMDVYKINFSREIFGLNYQNADVDFQNSKIGVFVKYFEKRSVEKRREKQSYTVLGMEVLEWNFRGYIRKGRFFGTNESFINEETGYVSKADDFSRVLENVKNFEPNSWRYVETYLKKIGMDDEASEVRVRMKKQQLKNATLRKDHNVVRYYFERLLNWPTNYGTKLAKPIYMFLLPLFLLSSLLFSNPQNVTPTFNALEAYGGYDEFYKDNNKDTVFGEDIPDFKIIPKEQVVLTYKTVCIDIEDKSEKKLHPICNGSKWGIVDGFQMALTYHIPMINYVIEPSWEARSEKMPEDYCLFKIPKVKAVDYPNGGESFIDIDLSVSAKETLCFKIDRYITPGNYTFFATLISWILLPLYIYALTNRLFNLNNI